MLCNRANNTGKLPNQHKCSKNWDGTSTSMDADTILEGFMTSMDMYDEAYANVIGEGASAVQHKITERIPYGLLQ